MEITVLQLVGVALIWFGVYCIIKGKIEWSFEMKPNSHGESSFHVDLTPDKYCYQEEGVYQGKWLKPICILAILLGFLFILVFKGQNVVFTL